MRFSFYNEKRFDELKVLKNASRFYKRMGGKGGGVDGR